MNSQTAFLTSRLARIALWTTLATLAPTGAIWAATPAVTLTTLHSFAGKEGQNPLGALIQAPDGNFYGTTQDGGPNPNGTIFKLTPAGTFTDLYNFDPPADPTPGLTEGADGNFYGVSTFGGSNDTGTIFKITSTGAFTNLYTFSSLGSYESNTDGAYPSAPLIKGMDGYFFGTTYAGGNFAGSFFRITATGLETTQHLFNHSDEAPSGTIVQTPDSTIYGTSVGYSVDPGTFFKVTPAGALTTLHTFAADAEPTGVLLAADGNFYGTTSGEGTSGAGTVFKLTPAGELTTLYNFSSEYAPDGDGHGEKSALIQGSDGNFYGTTESGGSAGAGTIYRITPTGDLTTLYEFSGGADGGTPYAALLQGRDGNLYGSTIYGGAYGHIKGTIFRLNINLPSVVQFNHLINSVKETAGTASIRVNRIGGTGAITVHYATSDGSAVAGTDYKSTSGTLAWAAGDQAPKLIAVPILDRGLTNGSLHTFNVTLSNPAGATSLGYPATASVTINDAPRVAPAITSARTAAATDRQPFSYQITASNRPLNYRATGLRDGLTLNTRTGVISGTPTTPGIIHLTIFANNDSGSGSEILTITVAPIAPEIISPATATAGLNRAFYYQIEARNTPTSYSATGLRDGLTLDPSSGVISGKPGNPGTIQLSISATNSAGTGSENLTITVVAPPVITSPATAAATVGQPFSYRITASHNPTGFGASGVRDGLSFDYSTGVFSGVPATAGTLNLTISASNAGGTTSANLTINVAASAQ